MVRRTKPTSMRAPPTTANHWAMDPSPVKARDPESAWTTGSAPAGGSDAPGSDDPSVAAVTTPAAAAVDRAGAVDAGAVDAGAAVGVVEAPGAAAGLGSVVPVGAGGSIVVGVVEDDPEEHPGGEPVFPSAL